MDEDQEQPEADGPTCRFADAVTSVVNYHVEEYDLTAATVVGVLAIEAIRRTLHTLRVEIGSENEDEDDE